MLGVGILDVEGTTGDGGERDVVLLQCLLGGDQLVPFECYRSSKRSFTRRKTQDFASLCPYGSSVKVYLEVSSLCILFYVEGLEGLGLAVCACINASAF